MQHDNIFERNNIVQQKVKHVAFFDRRRHVDALQRAVIGVACEPPRARGEIGRKEFARLGNQRGHLGFDRLPVQLFAGLDDLLNARHG